MSIKRMGPKFNCCLLPPLLFLPACIKPYTLRGSRYLMDIPLKRFDTLLLIAGFILILAIPFSALGEDDRPTGCNLNLSNMQGDWVGGATSGQAARSRPPAHMIVARRGDVEIALRISAIDSVQRTAEQPARELTLFCDGNRLRGLSSHRFFHVTDMLGPGPINLALVALENDSRLRVRLTDKKGSVEVLEFLRKTDGGRPFTIATEKTEWALGEAQAKRVPAPERLEQLYHDVRSRKVDAINSLILSVAGELVLEEYFYGASFAHVHNIHSATKSITGLGIGLAIDKGILPGVETPISELSSVVANYPDSHWVRAQVPVSLQDLLRMANVVGWGDSSFFGQSGSRANGFSLTARMANTAAPLEELLDSSAIMECPGPYMNYNGVFTDALARILHENTDDQEDLILKSLFQPLGIETYIKDYWASADWHMRPAPIAGHGWLYLRPRDMLKLGEMVASKGEFNGKQVVPRQWIEDATRVHSLRHDASNEAYGYHWNLEKYIDPVSKRIIWTASATGWGGQLIVVVPYYESVFVATAANFDHSGITSADLVPEYVLPALSGANSTFLRAPVTPDDLGHSVFSVPEVAGSDAVSFAEQFDLLRRPNSKK